MIVLMVWPDAVVVAVNVEFVDVADFVDIDQHIQLQQVAPSQLLLDAVAGSLCFCLRHCIYVHTYEHMNIRISICARHRMHCLWR